MTTGCRSRSHPVEQQRVRAPIVVVPSTRPARLDATASTVRFLRSSACAARKTGRSRQEISGRPIPSAVPVRRAARTSRNLCVAAHAQCRAFRGMPKTRRFSFVLAASGARVALSMRAMDARSRFVRGLAAPGGATKIRRGLLTVEKTVIRFRPKQTVPARTSEPNQREKRQYDTDLRPDDRQGGRRRFLRENASTPE